MAVECTMPKFGLTMHEGTVQRFFKKIGSPVRAGEPLYEVETEKVLYEVEAPASGTLALTLFDEGATVECGVAVAIIAEEGESLDDIRARYPQAAAASNGSAAAAAPAEIEPTRAAPKGGERRSASPIARKLAAELGVNLDNVNGTGPGGRITREDVERAAKEPAKPAAAKPAATPPKAAGPRQTIAFRGMRKTIAERMHQSLRDTAQLTITHEADVTAAVEVRERLKSEFDFTYTDLLIQAVARAIRKHPRLGAHFDGHEILLPEEINIGLAVALEEGLIVPVIRNVNAMSLREIAVESKEAGEKARAGKLKLEDVTGATLTISNLGAYGIDAFTPIINPGETAILGTGRIIEKPVVYRGEITRRSTMMLSLTFDHRIVDGAPAAAFLKTVVELFNYGER